MVGTFECQFNGIRLFTSSLGFQLGMLIGAWMIVALLFNWSLPRLFVSKQCTLLWRCTRLPDAHSIFDRPVQIQIAIFQDDCFHRILGKLPQAQSSHLKQSYSSRMCKPNTGRPSRSFPSRYFSSRAHRRREGSKASIWSKQLLVIDIDQIELGDGVLSKG